MRTPKPHAIRRPASPKQTEKTFGVSTKRSRKIDGLVDEVIVPSADEPIAPRRRKLRAASLDAEGERFRAREMWLLAAKAELETATISAILDNDTAVRADVAEAVACLANALRPLTKDETRAVVQRFLKAVE